ncbi:hypothetical protein D3C73_1278520 [compost metagenome]
MPLVYRYKYQGSDVAHFQAPPCRRLMKQYFQSEVPCGIESVKMRRTASHMETRMLSQNHFAIQRLHLSLYLQYPVLEQVHAYVHQNTMVAVAYDHQLAEPSYLIASQSLIHLQLILRLHQ